MVRYETSGRCIRVNGEKLNFPAAIEQALEFEDMIIVVLSFDDDYGGMYQNIISINADGDIRWRVEEMIPDDSPPAQYTGVSKRDGELWAHSPLMRDFKIDPETGRVLDSKRAP